MPTRAPKPPATPSRAKKGSVSARILLALRPEDLAALGQLRARWGAASVSDTIRRAIQHARKAPK